MIRQEEIVAEMQDLDQPFMERWSMEDDGRRQALEFIATVGFDYKLISQRKPDLLGV